MEEKNKTPQITDSGINQDVLEILAQDNILKSISDETQMNRVILNCFCELLSVVKELKSVADDFYTTISICSNEKIQEFFGKLDNNLKEEQKRQEALDIVAQSHQKKKPRKSKVKKIDFTTIEK